LSEVEDALQAIQTTSAECALSEDYSAKTGREHKMTVTRRFTGVSLVALAAALFVSVQGSAMAGWETANGFEDPDGKWASEARASDGDAGLYAVDKTNAARLGAPLRLRFGAPDAGIVAKKLRVKADWWGPFCEKIVIKIEYRDDGGNWVWHALWDAPFTAADNAVYKYIDIPQGKRRIRSVQFQWKYKVAGYWWWLYECQLFEVDGAQVPQAETLEPSSVNAESAVLRGRVEKDGNDICQVLFQYGTGASFTSPGENDPDWTGDFGTGEARSRFVNGLTPGVTYYYRAVVRNSAGSHAGAVKSFVACPEEGEDGSVWVSPTGWGTGSHTYNGHTYEWQDGGNAFDDWNESSARCYHEIHDGTLWSPWLQLDVDSGLYNGLRFRASKPDAFVEKIEVQVMSSEWEQVYIGGFQHNTFEVKDFSMREVSQARVRFKMSQAGVGAFWNLYEFDLKQIGVNVIAQGTPYYLEEHPGVFLATNAPAFPVTFKFASGIKNLEWGTVTVQVNPRLKLYLDAACTQEFTTGTDHQRTYNLALSNEKSRFVSELLDKTLHAKGITVSTAERDSPVSCEVAYDYTEVSDTVNFTVRSTFVDLDADSDNTTVETYPDPSLEDRSAGEDAKEDTDDHAGLNLTANWLDEDEDGVPDYADGINRHGNAGEGSNQAFERIVLDLKGVGDIGSAKITFTYPASDPRKMTAEKDELSFITYRLPESGVLRLWLKDGPRSRKVEIASEGGDYVAPGVQYSAADLGIGEGHVLVLYLECVDIHSTARVEVSVDVGGNGQHKAKDSIKTNGTEADAGNPANLSVGR